MKFQSKLFLLIIIISLFYSNVLSNTILLDDQDKTIYQVVVNHEEQYSIWPMSRTLPKNWKSTGVKGSKATCFKHISEIWTDMRPLSIRKMNLPKETRYGVVINHEEQYSIWPLKLSPPKGWKFSNKRGNLKECMNYIEEVWTDMRPLSIRK